MEESKEIELSGTKVEKTVNIESEEFKLNDIQYNKPEARDQPQKEQADFNNKDGITNNSKSKNVIDGNRKNIVDNNNSINTNINNNDKQLELLNNTETKPLVFSDNLQHIESNVNNEFNDNSKGDEATIVLNIDDTKVRLTKFRTTLLLFGLFLTYITTGYDRILATSLLVPIASNFDEYSKLGLFGIAYLLTSFIMERQYKRLIYVFSYKAIILLALISFLIGTIISSTSVNLTMLIVGRAIAGIGGGGLPTLCNVIIKELVPAYRLKTYMIIYTLFFIAASVSASMLVGLFMTQLSWRWCFYISIPTSSVAIVILLLFLPRKSKDTSLQVKLHNFDFIGSVSLFLFTTLLSLSLNRTSLIYPWSSYQALLPLCISVLFLFLFIYSQKYISKQPTLPAHLFYHNVILCCLISFFNGAVLFIGFIFIPYYYKITFSLTANQTTPTIITIIFSLLLGYLAISLIIKKFTVYRWYLILSTGLGVVASCLLAIASYQLAKPGLFYLFVALVGVSIGLSLKITGSISELAVKAEDIQEVKIVNKFFFSFGGVIGIIAADAIYFNVLKELLEQFKQKLDIDMLIDKPSLILELESQLRQGLVACYKLGFRTIFYGFIAFFSVGFISSCSMRPIMTSNKK
ncbi:MFS general substrate transporter [Neoconidiobolus thromboides FSU 785]|nr:MFS general substrate transporter [Neoconidiobolus thromboides FSU 785]